MDRSALSETEIDKLLDSIKWASADYEWARVKELTTQVLEQDNLPPGTRVVVLRRRGTALQRLGEVHEAQRDLETAVSTAEEAGLLHDQIDALNHLSFHLGIMLDNATALHYANIALELARQSGSVAQQAVSHYSIADAYASRSMRDDQFLGQSEHAQRAIALGQQSGNKMAEAGGYKILAGFAAERDNNPAQAEAYFQKSTALYREVGQLDHACKVHHAATSYNLDLNLKLKHNLQAYRLAIEINNDIAELAAGDFAGARRHTAEAVSLPKLGDNFYPVQEVWWWHYRASDEWHVTSGERRMASEKEPLPDALFEILDRARLEMLDYIASINDEALRRSYLNKVPINRDITLDKAGSSPRALAGPLHRARDKTGGLRRAVSAPRGDRQQPDGRSRSQ